MNYEEYKKLEEERLNIAIGFMEQGVIFADIHTAYIDASVQIESGAYIGPCVTLEGNTVIGAGARIYQNSRIVDSEIGPEAEVQSSVILESSVGKGTKVGPFAYIRPNSKIGENCKVGDFVEMKNSTFGDGSKTAHLTYVGDADVGKNVNLGCGIVFVNYDGNEKFRTTVGDGAFIGCNTNLISPVKVGARSYIAAGSTITEDVPEDALGIARSHQTVKEGWAAKRGLYRNK